MTMKRLLRHTLLMAAACLACSCSREAAEVPAQGPVRFGIDTRAAGDGVEAGTTYRIMAYAPATLALQKAGTYRLASLPAEGGVAELTPCALNDLGNVVDGEAVTFDGTIATYSLVFVSPGIKGNDDGSFNINLAELGTKDGCGFVLSEFPESKHIGTYGRIVMTRPMKQCRARIGIDFYKAGNVKDFKIENLRITGAGKTGGTVTFFPAKRQVRVNPDEGIGITLQTPAESRTDDKGNTLRYTTAEGDFPAIVSAIYAPRDVAKKILGIANAAYLEEGAYLVMKCDLTPQGREPVAVELPLTTMWPEVLPQRIYRYRVVVSSNYINLAVDVSGDAADDWEEGNPGSGGEIVVGPSATVELGTWEIVQAPGGNGWKLEELDEQVIGGSGDITED